MQSLIDEISRAQENSEEALLNLIHEFSPLIRKYFRKLIYEEQEDAFADLQLDFIQIIKSFPTTAGSIWNDLAVRAYLKTSMKHAYEKRSVASTRYRKRNVIISEMDEKTQSYLESKSSCSDEYSNLDIQDLRDNLSEKEYQVFYDIVYSGLSAADIAREHHITRQAVHKTKDKAALKLQKVFNLPDRKKIKNKG